MVEEVRTKLSLKEEFERFLKSFFSSFFYKVSERKSMDLNFDGLGTKEYRGYVIKRGLLAFSGTNEFVKDSVYVIDYSPPFLGRGEGIHAGEGNLELFVNEECSMDRVRKFSRAYQDRTKKAVMIVQNF